MRLDGVLFRLRDTRIFVEFATGEVIREYTAREQDFETVRRSLVWMGDDILALMRDPNRLADKLPIVEKTVERLVLK